MSRDRATVSFNMSRIKGKDTSIELILRRALFHNNIRYYKNYSKLPGKPDILISKYKIAIFCDGDFFHGYDLTKTESQLKTNSEYWKKKIENNRNRDRINDEKLCFMGYTVLHFWEHEIRNNLSQVLNEINDVIIQKKLDKDRKNTGLF
ncbi:MAG: very short patch repair endonuclease [Bacilli bacterium]